MADTPMQQAHYQLIIIGGGPAGLTAGLYASRGRLHVLLVEKGATGGQVITTDWVDNYPGFVEGIGGFDLMDKMASHADRFGLPKKNASVQALELEEPIKKVILEDGSILTADTIILCTGAKPQLLNIPGEYEFTGRGVAYCATCDGPFYRGQEVAVIGGGNTALQEALHLTKFADKVTIIHRRDELRAAKILQEKALAEPKINFLWNTQVTQIKGTRDTGVEELRLENVDGKESSLMVSGVFVFIGIAPNNALFASSSLKMDANGFLVTDEEMATSIPGVFAAGDIRSKHTRQIINAAGEGAVAELSAERYLSGQIPSPAASP
ncbi:MAG: thioredoxin-disulfide reductase [Desulfobulbus sp.]|jgi:thioredoxin reductase (NADPH)